MEKVKLNKKLPYLVGNVVEVLEPEAEDGVEEDFDAQRKTRSVVIWTSTRQTVDTDEPKPSDLVVDLDGSAIG